MLPIAVGLQSPASAVPSSVRDSEVFGEFSDLSPSYGLGFCDGLELLLGHRPDYGPAETRMLSVLLVCMLKGARCRYPTDSGGECFSLVQTLTLTSWWGILS